MIQFGKREIEEEKENVKQALNSKISSLKMTQEQIDIINDNNDILLVDSVAGSGKTTTIINKIETYKDLNYSTINLISYNRENIESLKGRLKVKNEDYRFIEADTLHQYSINFLYKINDKYKKYKFYDQIDLIEKALNHILNKNKEKKENFTLELSLLNKFTKPHGDIEITLLNKKDEKIILDLLTAIQGKKIYSIDLINVDPKDVYRTIYLTIHLTIEEFKVDNSVFEFEDIIGFLIEELNNPVFNKDIKDIKLFILDEYQDFTEQEFDLIRLIKDKYNMKLVFVGDENQNIYQWRNSSNNPVRYLRKIFPNLVEKKLTQSFRTHKDLTGIVNEKLKKIDEKRNFVSYEDYENSSSVYHEGSNETENLNEIISNTLNKKENLFIICNTNTDIEEINKKILKYNPSLKDAIDVKNKKPKNKRKIYQELNLINKTRDFFDNPDQTQFDHLVYFYQEIINNNFKDSLNYHKLICAKGHDKKNEEQSKIQICKVLNEIVSEEYSKEIIQRMIGKLKESNQEEEENKDLNDIRIFGKKIKSNKVYIGTIFSFKGLEADNVIEYVNKPTYYGYKDNSKILDYLKITRAKKRFYKLT